MHGTKIVRSLHSKRSTRRHAIFHHLAADVEYSPPVLHESDLLPHPKSVAQGSASTYNFSLLAAHWYIMLMKLSAPNRQLLVSRV